MCGLDNRNTGRDYPVIRDDGTLRNCCEVLQGGVIKPQAPIFTPFIVQEADLIWRDDDLSLVLDGDGALILIDDGGL